MGEERVLRRMKRQYGIVSREQALADGLTESQIKYRLRTGKWATEARGVYRHAAVSPTSLSRLLAVCLAQRRGVPCTGLSRTVLDLAAVVSRKRLDRTIDAVLRDRQLRPSDLYGVLASHARRGRAGCGALRASLEARRGDDPVPLSEWGRMVQDLLVEAGLGPPRLEYRICRADGSLIAQVDLAYPRHRLAIELDSVRYHLNRESFVSDPRRRNRLMVAGWNVLTFTWDDYINRPADLCSTVAVTLDSA